MRKVCLLSVVCWLLAGCANFLSAQYHGVGDVQHVVVLWFKSDLPERYVSEVADRTSELASIPGIRSIKTGKPIASDRPMVDDSFDLAVTMTFDSEEAMQRYVAHPEHKAFLKRYIIGKTERILIYDYR
jgi:heme-degrading monooxygenase HmoA